MITKFDTIKNMAVFKDFQWDKSVLDKDGKSVQFARINVLYGRNYSGKTTLSRIVRALETHTISDKYNNPEFSITFKDGTNIDQNSFSGAKAEVRVFNEDFVRENLSFLQDTSCEDGDIKSFSAVVLGETNNTIQTQIDVLTKELGSQAQGKETNLYKESLDKKNIYDKAKAAVSKKESEIERKLSEKATINRTIAIKYNTTYGDPSYNILKLKQDIKTVSSYSCALTEEEKEKYKQTIKETPKLTIQKHSLYDIEWDNLTESVKEVVERKIGETQTIINLVNEIELSRWVRRGMDLHKDKKLNVCSFCGQPITEHRWNELDAHFNEESDKLDNDIDSLLGNITNIENSLNNFLVINKQHFYAFFESRLITIENEFESAKNNILSQLKSLKQQLENRKNHFEAQKYAEVDDKISEINSVVEKLNIIIDESNLYTSSLKEKQTQAKEKLRLDDVYCYVQTINYHKENTTLDSLKKSEGKAKEVYEKIVDDINDKEKKITSLESSMKDEQAGAKKVNEYIRDYLGNSNLELKAIETGDPNRKYKYSILRDGITAYHLSEGECSLIAFCYFVARLDEVNTQNKKLILWIDDPISSLDSNHVFFIYSLIHKLVVEKQDMYQWFISTHNLDFFKYLKRIPGVYNESKHEVKNKAQFFIINRVNDSSSIQLMPFYMHAYVTEFNYLFKQIYECATIAVIDDTNFSLFYNFGNNARKFLEIYLFYKYPDATAEAEKRERFFGDMLDSIEVNRLNNEYSHLCGVFERGESLVEVPEMQQIAKVIIQKIKENDEDQYNALLNSISVTP